MTKDQYFDQTETLPEFQTLIHQGEQLKSYGDDPHNTFP